MAVNFQRRNIGVLADAPTFEDVGQSSYVDYAAEALNAPAPAVMRQAVQEADAAPTALAGPQTPEAMAQYEAAQKAYLDRALVDAERKAKAAGNPINVVGSVLGGIIGAPFSLLENAVGGGNNDLTAPFTPKQNALGPLAQARANIAAQKLTLAQRMDAGIASQSQAMTAALTDRSKLRGDVSDMVANAAIDAKYAADPNAFMSNRVADLMQDPLYGPEARIMGLDKLTYTPDLARSMARGKDAIARLDKEAEAARVSPINSQWMADRVAAAKELYPDVPVQELASNSDVLLSPAVSSQYNRMLAARGGIVAESTARGRREGAPPVSSGGGGGSKKAGKPNVSGMSLGELIKGAGL